VFVALSAAEYQLRYTQALAWATGHTYSACIASYTEPYPYGPFPNLMAVGADALYEGSWIPFSPPRGKLWVGAISYDYACRQLGFQGVGHSGFTFFSPRHVLQWRPDGVEIQSPEAERIWQTICAQDLQAYATQKTTKVDGEHFDTYGASITSILNHWHQGEAYEVNYCRKEVAHFEQAPQLAELYGQLTQKSPMPFQFVYQSPTLTMAGSSPERFLRKEGPKLITQPIKGTVKRGSTQAEDEALKATLTSQEKILAENMMITDLVRNDLVQICESGSVEVDELFGVYTFPQLHQLITTVTGSILREWAWEKLLGATFPMGSMTGAPKRRAIEIIAETEATPRGYFSGAFGYILPNGDFDLAVIIRTLFLQNLSVEYWSGGAIVWDSTAEQEWAETALKMESMRFATGS